MIISIVIIILLIFGIIIGAKRGFTYQLIKMLGIFLVLFLSLLLKNKLALFLLNHFDFIEIDPAISILLYRGISFIILFFIFRLLLRLILKLSKNFEKILNATIILGIPSKILGAILGFIEYYIYIFIILVILNIPIFKLDFKDSSVANFILNKTPFISSNSNVTLIEELAVEFNKGNNASSDKMVDILVKYNVIDKTDADNFIKEKYNNKEVEYDS